MAAELSDLTERAEHYRHLVAVVRARAASMKTREARDALVAVANDYELLARYADSIVSTWQTMQRRPDE